METSAVIDRIEEGRLAVLLVEPEEREWIVPIEELPPDAQAGDWLRIRVEDDRLVHARVDPERTQAVAARIQDKMALLRQRGRHLRPQ